ncbi:Cell cycle checkpoint protein rad17 [Homalodisca vitripennis]|nr:Cell cycle checkpoint protein rad17 [Homalodisca vitripennis]
MSWISPTFGEGSTSTPPSTKKSIKTKTEHCEEPPVQPPSQTASVNWLQQYRPKTTDELVVHVKKIREVESWLEQSINATSKFLLLTGPSGCGKTTTLQTLCKSLKFKIQEWITPLDKPDDEFELPSKSEYIKSSAKTFEEYLLRSSRYSSILSASSTKKLVLVKDFPNVLLHNPSKFHEILEDSLDKCVNPVVFICSDEAHCKKLFPVSLRTNCRIHTIAFNPIPDQRMLKVLKSILTQENRSGKNIKMISDEALYTVCTACQGDLRSAISKLYFTTINSSFNISQLQPKRKFKKPKSGEEHTPTEKDRKLDFFHGIGRVLYPKKIESDKGFKFVHSTDEIVDNFLSGPNSFISQLHENYPSKLGDIYDIRDAADRLCKSDMLMSRWQDKDIFHYYSLSVAVKGLMISNRTPQKAKFEAFKKSQTSRLEIDSKAIELEGKDLFSEMCILNYETLIDVLPYSRLLLPNLNQGQLDFVLKTCHFK